MIGSSGVLVFGSLLATLATATPIVSNPLLATRQAPNATVNRACGNSWKLDSSFVGSQFFDGFDWETQNDPTGGRVNYVSLDEARSNGLTWADDKTFGMAADSKKKLDSADSKIRGRDSVRIISKKSWTDFVIISDIAHMPTGCGTWPAFWTLGEGAEWPNAGEIDIVEGANDDQVNGMTIHTGEKAGLCNMPKERNNTQGMEFWGKEGNNLCTGKAGCTVHGAPFGARLNEIGGGWFVTRRDARGISIWFWPRSAGDVPEEVRNPSGTLDETLLGPKIADFPVNEQCQKFDEMLLAQKIIFNLTFCGGWGTDKYMHGNCGKSLGVECNAYVDQNPEAFKEAYWVVNGVHVYTPAL